MRRYPGDQIEYGGEGEDLARDTGRRKLVEKGGGISFPPEIDWCEFRDSTAGCLGTQESQAQTDPTKTLACQEPQPTGALCLGQGYCCLPTYAGIPPTEGCWQLGDQTTPVPHKPSALQQSD